MKNKSKSKQAATTQQPETVSASAPQKIQAISNPKPAVAAAPTHDEIAKRAEEIYYAKGCPQGQNDQIWLQAEQELRNRSRATASSK